MEKRNQIRSETNKLTYLYYHQKQVSQKQLNFFLKNRNRPCNSNISLISSYKGAATESLQECL